MATVLESAASPLIVLLAGDEEYRSEECLPMLAKILTTRHGFRCRVVLPIGPDGTIDPECQTNLPGIEALDDADLMICMLRFRNLPEKQMGAFDRYVRSGKPVIGLRTSTHAFQIPADSPFADYDFRKEGGFGRKILGETWVAHHGQHLVQSCRTVAEIDHPILKGVESIWVPSDVYTAAPPKDATILLRGSVRTGMNSSDPAVEGPVNRPMMPVAWTRELGRQKVFTTTMGSGLDFQDENLRRLIINACYWALNQPIPNKAPAGLTAPYDPSPIGFGKHRRGVKLLDQSSDGALDSR